MATRTRLRRRPRRDASGFSMIELIVALTIFSIVLLGLVALIVVGLGRMSYSRLRTQATETLRQEMDRLESLAFSHPDLGPGTHGRASDADSLSWNVTDNYPVTGARRLDMTVSWKNPVHQTERFSVTTYLVDRP